MIDLKPYYQVKLTLLGCKTYFLHNPPKTEDEKYVYDLILKTWWINLFLHNILLFRNIKYYTTKKLIILANKKSGWLLQVNPNVVVVLSFAN